MKQKNAKNDFKALDLVRGLPLADGISHQILSHKSAQKAQFGSKAERTRQYVSILKWIATPPSGKR
jgi:hypothetical protein